jgi:hypothetical protein
MEITIDKSLANDMLAWATSQWNVMTADDFGGDWWGSFSPDWDVNIWDNNGDIRVVAYPMFSLPDDGGVTTDMGSFVFIGNIETDRNWVRESQKNRAFVAVVDELQMLHDLINEFQRGR